MLQPLLTAVIIGLMIIFAAKVLTYILIEVCVACSKFARLVDRTPNAVIIAVSFGIVFGPLALALLLG